MAEPRSDTGGAFYVGYLPLPRALRRPLFFITGLSLWLLAGLSFVWAVKQNDPGAGRWDDQSLRTFTGVILTTPYPMLIEHSDGEPTAHLLVEMGKRGSLARTQPWDRKGAKVSGYVIEREGRRIIELDPGDSAIVADAGPQPSIEPAPSLGPVTLRGEIVDSKCFLGAMKPGEGKPHKACATLCVRGGIPPMLVTARPGGGHEFYLLCRSGGAPMDDGLLPLIAEPVEVAGTLTRRAGLNILEVDRVSPR